MPTAKAELVGANQEVLRIKGKDGQTSVKLDRAMRQKVSNNLKAAVGPTAAGRPTPDRVFLNLEKVRANLDSVAFHVYVGLGPNEKPEDHPERLAGTIGLFGVSDASRAGGDHAGQGLSYTLDITDIVDELHLKNAFDVDSLNVRTVPISDVPEAANVTVGRVSIYRQGQ